MNLYGLFFILSGLISVSFSFNLEARQNTTKIIRLPAIRKGIKIRRYFGYDFVLNNTTLIVGAPKKPEQSKKDLNGLFKCKVNKKYFKMSKNVLHTCTKTQTTFTGNFGLSISKPFNQSEKVCSVTKPKYCAGMKMLPGICYNRKDFRKKQSWQIEKRNGNFEYTCIKKFPMDIMFVLDGSNSVGEDNFNTVKKWISTFANSFLKYNNRTQIGVVQYSHYFYSTKAKNYTKSESERFLKTEINLNEISNFSSFNESVQKITLHNFTTYTAHALNKTVEDFKSSYRYNLSSTVKILILLTDGASSDSQYLPQTSNYLKSLNITTIAVGVGNVIIDELMTITNNDTSRYFYVNKFISLKRILKSLQNKVMSMNLEGINDSNSTVIYNLEYAQIGTSSATTKSWKDRPFSPARIDRLQQIPNLFQGLYEVVNLLNAVDRQAQDKSVRQVFG